MNIAIADHSIEDAGDQPRAPHTYHVSLVPELSLLLHAHAVMERVKPETIIAEAVRAYLGVE